MVVVVKGGGEFTTVRARELVPPGLVFRLPRGAGKVRAKQEAVLPVSLN